MAIPKLYTLARMTTATTGTGTITLGSAATSGGVTFLSFSAAGVADGEIVAYAIADTNASEYGYGTYTASGTTLTRNVIRSTNSNSAINLSGSAQVFITAGGPDLLVPTLAAPRNYSLAASVAANALTIALKDQYGSDPSALSPVIFDVRSSTASTGSVNAYAIRSATSLVVSSGSTLGASNGVAFTLWIVLFDDAGTPRLGVINPTTSIVDPGVTASSTAEGGAGAADSANTYYTGTAVTSKPFRILGTMNWSSGLVTAGTWAAGPTTISTQTGLISTFGSTSGILKTVLGVPAVATSGTDYGTVSSVAQTFTGGLISVGGSPVTTTGTLALTVAGTSGGIPYFSSASTWASSAALAANALVIGGGAGSAPSTTTTGTGVLTALGVNTGSAGAFVVNGGALGTPSSGTLSSCTGLPISTGVSGLGTGVATALAANVGAAGSFLATGTTATITKGFTVTPNSVSTGSFTVDPSLGNYQYVTNGGAFTLTAPASDCAVDILVTNNASAGAITFSGFTVGSATGSALTTTNTSKFLISVRRINGTSTYSIYALQ